MNALGVPKTKRAENVPFEPETVKPVVGKS